MSQSTAEILQARFSSLNSRVSSIEVMQLNKETSNNNTSIETTELPDKIKWLITGSEFWINAKTNRYKKLIREGHLNLLLALANEASKKDKPSFWFAKCASKALWEKTLVRFTAYKEKLQEVAQKAHEVAERLGTNVTKFIYKQIWKGVNVIRYAALAAESGRVPIKLFTWYCLHDKEIAL